MKILSKSEMVELEICKKFVDLTRNDPARIQVLVGEGHKQQEQVTEHIKSCWNIKAIFS